MSAFLWVLSGVVGIVVGVLLGQFVVYPLLQKWVRWRLGRRLQNRLQQEERDYWRIH